MSVGAWRAASQIPPAIVSSLEVATTCPAMATTSGADCFPELQAAPAPASATARARGATRCIARPW